MREVHTLEELPSLPGLYVKAALSALRSGRRTGLEGEALELRDHRIDTDEVAAYARVCGFRLRDELPPTFLHVAAFPMAVGLMAQPSFPFALPGLVHIANRITHHRPVRFDERPSLQVTTAGLRAHPKGTSFDVVAEARIAGDPVWEDVSTYLARGATPPVAGGTPPDRGGGSGVTRDLDVDRADDPVRLEVGKDVGRRYAAVSGDRNPIHLSTLAARVFGFRRAIAHGMWTAARCLAALEGLLPPSFVYDVRFERPVLLPSAVELTTRRTEDAWQLALHAAANDHRHLTAEVRTP